MLSRVKTKNYEIKTVMNPIHLAVCLIQNFPGAGKLKVLISSLQALFIRVEMFRRSIGRENRYRIMFSSGIGNNSMGYEDLIVVVLAEECCFLDRRNCLIYSDPWAVQSPNMKRQN